ncbi:hypothetical protein [Herbidospora sp. NBRC 101105]|uniref:hypothetical protein n=1 Tax=Herbidospora sp. NBRC 101105 TaxID=3032195 RepID=UPI0024A60888|nr:hypothetical protein [Herbidospora sp. NBRC 101105]GLX98206.1 hypothetical protein Hesp01_61560 [Herbidospora sp. NBRC 101105]
MRLSFRRVLAALLLTLAFAGTGIPAAQAADTCRVGIEIKTGLGDNGEWENWGIRDDSFEHITLGGQPFLFEDWDGDGIDDDRPRPYHRGGTGDEGGVWLDPWFAHLAACDSPADVAGELTIEHVSLADDWEADNWRLAAIRIFRIVGGTEETLFRLDEPEVGHLHQFGKNSGQTFTVDVGDQPGPPADPARRVCRVAFEITTGPGDWGIRDDSFEHVSLGGQPFLFDDWDGDGAENERPRPYRRGGTGDRGGVTLPRWEGRLAVCAKPADLADGFTFEHVSMAEDWRADNWSLSAVKITDLDTGVVLVDQAAPPGEVLHEFFKNAGQVFHTLDLDSDGDGLSDRIELEGIPTGSSVDKWLPDNGADPCRGTVAVEVDWLVSADGDDGPDRAAVDEAVAMFAAAPFDPLEVCPYAQEKKPGLQLLVHLDDGLHVFSPDREAPLNVEGDDGRTPFQNFRAAAFTPGRAGLFRYNLWGYRHNNTDESGWCCDGRDFVVTLGTMPDPPVRVQSATFVHELGHALGLEHGGTDEVNYKPNHLSVMNYRYQATGIPDIQAWRELAGDGPATDGGTRLLQALDQVSTLDWSRRKLPTLHRGQLNETAGIGVTTHAMAAWWDNTGTLQVGDGSAALNWDADATPGETSVEADVNGEFQKCVEGNGRLETQLRPRTPEYDDLRRYERIYAGLNGRCQTPWEVTDRSARVPGDDGLRTYLGYDYPAQFRYDTGLVGADDWRNIDLLFDSGQGGGAVLADEATELTTGELARDRQRVVDALVAASSPRPGQEPRWGYAYMDRATVAEAPIGVVTPLTTQWQWSTGRLDPATAGRRATVVHTGTGRYEVRLPGVASAAGVAHVTPYRTVYRGRTCGVVGYRPDGPDQLVEVRCFNEAGAPVDWWFTVFFAAPGPGETPYATVRYEGGDGMSYNDGTLNTAGGVNRVLREGTGRYRVVVEGEAFAEGTGYAQVTPYGDGAPARCNAVGVTPGSGQVEITVACHVIGTGAPADAPWTLSYTDGAGLHRDAGTPAAYAQVTGDPAAPVVDAARSFGGNGETPSVTRLGVGHYRLTWETLGKTGDSVQVGATGAAGGYCHLGTIDSYSAPPRVSVHVYCHTATGVPGDNTFGVAYVRAP